MSEDIALEEKKGILSKEEKSAFESTVEEEQVEEREGWGNKLDFLLACVGYAVGFGNVWRFPNLCYENGGGAFLIPYFIFLAICGMPLFLMELSISQYIGLGPIGCWKAISPALQGIGYGMLIISFLVCVYYNTIIAWVFYYLFESFRSDVPWRDCSNEWNSKDKCFTGIPPGNGIINQTIFNSTTNTTSYMLSCAQHFIPYYAMKNDSSPSTTLAPLSTIANNMTSTAAPVTSTLAATVSTLASNLTTVATNVTTAASNATAVPITVASTIMTTGVSITSTSVMVSKDVADKVLFNCTFEQKIRLLPADEYLTNYILNQSGGIHDSGYVKWQLALCLLFAWIFVYFCIWKGVASVGKVVYVTATFPYLVLFILLVRGATLNGSAKGVEYYLKPDFTKLSDPQVWLRAASQIFYSLGIGFGSLIAMGSYNKFNNNCYRDAVMVSLINCATSVFCGFVVFSVLGHLSEELGIDIKEVAQSGPGLVFVVYPSGISRMPISTLWAILFFLMLLTLGLDSQFAMMECVISGLSDEYPKYLRKYKELFILFVCVIAFLLGIPTVTQAGVYVVELFNTQAGGISLLFVAFFESVAIGWIYGGDRLLDNIETMTGNRPCRWWVYCWKYIAPVLILVTFLYGLAMWDGVQFGKGYTYPDWAEGLGWVLALVSMIALPIGFGYYYYVVTRTKNTFSPNDEKEMTWREVFRVMSSPDEARLKEIEITRGGGLPEHSEALA